MRKNEEMNDIICTDGEIFFYVDDVSYVEEKQILQCSFFTKKLLSHTEKLIEMWGEKPATELKNKKYRPILLNFSMKVNKNVHLLLKAINSKKLYKAKVVHKNIVLSKKDEKGINAVITVTGYGKVQILEKKIIFNDKEAPENIKKRVKNIMKKAIESLPLEAAINIDDLCIGKPHGIQVYRIGNANCNYIKYNNGNNDNRGVLFDIGYNSTKNNKNYVSFRIALMNMRPFYVVLSHWDLDHIKGYNFANNNVFDVPWIAPNYIVSIQAHLLALYLSKLKVLYLIDKNSIMKIKSSNIKLYLGCGRDGGINPINCKGIHLVVNDKAMLAGDVPYKCFDKNINYDNIKFIVVPHHGAKMTTSCLKFNNKYKRIAIISASGGINRPNCCHELYLKKYFKTYITENEPKSEGTNGFYYDIIYDSGKWV